MKFRFPLGLSITLFIILGAPTGGSPPLVLFDFIPDYYIL